MASVTSAHALDHKLHQAVYKAILSHKFPPGILLVSEEGRAEIFTATPHQLCLESLVGKAHMQVYIRLMACEMLSERGDLDIRPEDVEVRARLFDISMSNITNQFPVENRRSG